MAKRYLVQGVQQAMVQFKHECAVELGIPDYLNTDRGNLTARVNGSVGGEMVRRMVHLAQTRLTDLPAANR